MNALRCPTNLTVYFELRTNWNAAI